MNNLHYPPNVQWEVTSECNHNCIHCYNYWRKDFEKISGMSRVNSENEYLNIAKKIILQKPVSVVITGGEPLLVFDRIKSSIDLLLKHGIFVSINTNVALLDEEITDFLVSRKISLFVSFPCSDPEICDTITSTQHSNNKIITKLDLAYKKGIKFSVNIVVSKINLDYVEKTVEFLKDRYDISKVSITRVGKPINSDVTFDSYLLDKENIKKLQDICVKISHQYFIKIETSCPYTPCSLYSKEAFELFGYTKICTAGKTSYAIDTEGNIKACPRDSTLYGNILKDDFSKIWEALHKWRDDSYIPQECLKCKELTKCLGGCRVDSLPFTGNLNQLDLASDISNLPIHFEKNAIDSSKLYIETDKFHISDKVQYVVDNETIRISVGKTYIFATKELYQFIVTHNIFTLSELMECFSVNSSVANHVVKSLITNGIINKIL